MSDPKDEVISRLDIIIERLEELLLAIYDETPVTQDPEPELDGSLN